MRCYDKIASETDLVKICVTKKNRAGTGSGAQNVDAASAKLAQSFREASALAARIFEYFLLEFCSALYAVVGGEIPTTVFAPSSSSFVVVVVAVVAKILKNRLFFGNKS